MWIWIIFGPLIAFVLLHSIKVDGSIHDEEFLEDEILLYNDEERRGVMMIDEIIKASVKQFMVRLCQV